MITADYAGLLDKAADLVEKGNHTIVQALHEVVYPTPMSYLFEGNQPILDELYDRLVEGLPGETSLFRWENKWYRTKGAKVRCLRHGAKALRRTVT